MSDPAEIKLAADGQFSSLVKLYREAQTRKDITAAEAAESAVMELAAAEGAIAESNLLTTFAAESSTPAK